MPEFKHILVTGGAGFIGANFVRFVLGERPELRVTNVDALTYSGNLDNLEGLGDDPRYRFVLADICDAGAIEPLVADADAVIHMAAESHVDRSIEDASPFIRTNVVGTQVLLDAARRTWGDESNRRFLYVSTDEVYGSLPLDDRSLKFTEETPFAPNSPYAASKGAGDMLVRAYHHTFGLPTLTTRCSNNFGPYQFPEKVIPIFVTNLLDGARVPLYGDGRNIRDWLHVLDHCEAILTVLERGAPGEAYNVGGNNERSNLELTRLILEIMDEGEDRIERVPDRLGHDLRYAIDASKIERDLGWRPTRSAWPDALRETIDWYIDHATWWRRVKSGAYRSQGDAPGGRRASA